MTDQSARVCSECGDEMYRYSEKCFGCLLAGTVGSDGDETEASRVEARCQRCDTHVIECECIIPKFEVVRYVE